MAERSLRIMAVHRYYYPDTPPYATILRHIVSRWAQDGHHVEVLTSQPSYKKDAGIAARPPVEEMDGVRISRIDLPPEHGRPLTRIVNTLRFFAAIIFHAIRNRPYDVIMVSTAPPVIPGLAGRIAARVSGARLVYHCMDIHPEIGRISGDFSNPLIYRVLERLDAGTCRHATRVVVLSDDMAEAVRARKGCGAARLEVINNFALKSEVDGEAPLPELPAGEVRLLFAGNIGRFQGLEHFVDAMHRLAQRGYVGAHLVFMGEGTALPELKRRARGAGEGLIHFLPHQPVSVATAVMQRVELGVVSLVGGIYKYAYPSKTTTYMDNGCPMLVVVEKTSRLARDVEAEGVGVVVEPGNSEEIAACIETLLDNPSDITAMKANVSASAKCNEVSHVLSRWSDLIRDVAKETVCNPS